MNFGRFLDPPKKKKKKKKKKSSGTLFHSWHMQITGTSCWTQFKQCKCWPSKTAPNNNVWMLTAKSVTDRKTKVWLIVEQEDSSYTLLCAHTMLDHSGGPVESSNWIKCCKPATNSALTLQYLSSSGLLVPRGALRSSTHHLTYGSQGVTCTREACPGRRDSGIERNMGREN